MQTQKQSIVVLDIGTSKIAAIIADIDREKNIEVLARATVPTRAMSKGKIVDFNRLVADLEHIKEALIQDYNQHNTLGAEIYSAWVSIPSAEIYYKYNSGEVHVEHPQGIIERSDIARALDLAKAQCKDPNYYIMNTIPLSFVLNGTDHVQAPVGMIANTLQAYYSFMMMPVSSMQNIRQALKQAKITVDKIVVSSMANAESCLLEDERKYGVCLVDIGAGTTDVSVYIDGKLVCADSFPLGGRRVTQDIATYYGTSLEEAERLKLENGRLDMENIPPGKMIQYERLDSSTRTISQADLADSIAARYKEIINYVAKYLRDKQVYHALKHGIVLSGTAVDIEGVVDLFRKEMLLPIHLANASATHKMKKAAHHADIESSVYRTAVGLLLYSQNDTTNSQNGEVKTNKFFAQLDKIFSKVSKFMNRDV
ncbi:MAG: cell division protein FtsA [Acinetobacter sp.]|nr:cell division protein FtsA [Acinetobacter sp.]